MTRRCTQPDLFGGLHPVDGQAPARRETNDVDLIHTVAANAVRCGYLLVGVSERVYARTGGDEVARVPRYEEDAVHQLLRRRWLTLGAAHAVTCGAASLRGVALLVPRHTRDTVARWERLQRPPSWPRQRHTGDTPQPCTPQPRPPEPCTPGHGRPDQDARAGRVVRLVPERRRRR